MDSDVAQDDMHQLLVEQPAHESQSFSPLKTFFLQFRAIFLKDLAKQRTRYYTNLSQLLLPIFVLLVPLVVYWTDPEIPRNLDISKILRPRLTSDCGLWNCSKNMRSVFDDRKVSGVRTSDFVIFRFSSCCGQARPSKNRTMSLCVPFIQSLAIVDETGRGSEITDNIFHYEYMSSCKKSPVEVFLPTQSMLDDIWIDRNRILTDCYSRTSGPLAYYLCYKECINAIGQVDLCDNIAAGAVFHYIDDYSFKFDIQYQPIQISEYHDLKYMRYVSIISNAFWRMVSKKSSIPYSVINVIMLPTRPSPTNMNDSLAVTLASFIFLPLALQFLLPSYISDRVQEDANGLKQYIKIVGVSLMISDAVQYLFDYLLYFIVMLFTIIVGISSGYSFFTMGDPRHYIFLFLIWGHVQITLANLLRYLIRGSQIAGYIFVLVSMAIASVCNIFLFGMSMPPWWYLIHPSFVFMRCIAVIMFQYYANDEILGGSHMLNSQLLFLYSILIGELLLLQMINFMLSEIMHQNINFKTIIDKIFGRMVITSTLDVNNNEDIRIERENIENHSFGDRNVCLIVKSLSKSFNGRKIVDNMYLALDKNECFGLLGKNGAGKTSLINMISNFISPDSGYITVNGLSLSKAHKMNLVALCPQFDILFDDLTIEDHLLFLTRLKFSFQSITEEYEHVANIIHEMGLTEARRRLARDLSGGMKRKLSIAMALTGSPKVVLLDEPSTGLDPASRRDIWKIINNSVKNHNRCILLTTHAMEEAESLCDRIGIMKKGRLCCIGTISRLKELYGSGYRVSISVHSTTQTAASSNVESFIRNILPNAVLEYKSASHFVFCVQHIEVRLSHLFAMMDSQDERSKYGLSRRDGYGINWSVSKSSLEEIFLKIVKPNLVIVQ